MYISEKSKGLSSRWLLSFSLVHWEHCYVGSMLQVIVAQPQWYRLMLAQAYGVLGLFPTVMFKEWALIGTDMCADQERIWGFLYKYLYLRKRPFFHLKNEVLSAQILLEPLSALWSLAPPSTANYSIEQNIGFHTALLRTWFIWKLDWIVTTRVDYSWYLSFT